MASTARASRGDGTLPSRVPLWLTNLPTTPYPYVKVSEVQNSGTNGGTATSGSWTTRVLNTKDNDTSSIASLGSNQITLPAGTYLVRIKSNFHATDATKLRLQNITASTTLLISLNSYPSQADLGDISAEIDGLITLTNSSALAVQYYVETSCNTTGLGAPSNFGVNEVYTVAEFEKIA